MNHHRDSHASHIGHYDLLSYFAVAENEAVGRVKYTLLEVRLWLAKMQQVSVLAAQLGYSAFCPPLQKMVQPCGPPPAKKED